MMMGLHYCTIFGAWFEELCPGLVHRLSRISQQLLDLLEIPFAVRCAYINQTLPPCEI